MRLEVEPQGPDPLQAELTVHRLPTTLITILRSTPMKYTRARMEAQSDGEDFTFARCVREGFRFYGEGEDETFGCGEGALLFNGRSGTIDLGRGDVTMTIRVNGKLLRGAVRTLDDRCIHRLGARNGSLRLAMSYVESVLKSGELDPVLAHMVHSHIVDLLAFALRPDGDTGERANGGAIQAARMAAIRSDILANLSQVRLSARSVGERQGVSERYVYLLFEQNGLSFSRFVTTQRLERAMTMLLDPACAAMRISDIAYAVGFGDLTTFNRAFRQRYGDTPRAIRRAGAR